MVSESYVNLQKKESNKHSRVIKQTDSLKTQKYLRILRKTAEYYTSLRDYTKTPEKHGKRQSRGTSDGLD